MIIYSANLQHGTGTDGSTNYTRQANAFAGADIVCTQEQNTSDTGWNTPMSNVGLTQAVFNPHWGSAGDGNGIWISSSVTALQTYTFDMANGANPTSGSSVFGWDGTTDVRRSLCAIKAQVGGRQFYVVSLHLVAASGEDSSSTNFASQRVDQISSALGWVTSTLTGDLPVIIAGDLNTPINYPRAPERTYTADSSTDVITSTAHGFTDQMAVVLRNSGGAQPAPLSVGDSLYALATVYYVRDVTADTFKLAETRGGAAIDLTSNGTGSNFVCATQLGLFLEGGYTDLWQRGLNEGTASASWGDRDADGIPDMPLHPQLTRTHDSRRIDYFMVKGTGLVLTGIDVPDLRTTCSGALTTGGNFKQCPDVSDLVDFPEDQGIRPSDHNWIKVAMDASGGTTARVRRTQFSWLPNRNL